MNINTSHFANYTFSIFNEKVLSSLSQNKKNLTIVALALGCLVAAYLIVDCCLKSKTDSEEKLDDQQKETSSEADVNAKNIEATQKIVSFLKAIFVH